MLLNLLFCCLFLFGGHSAELRAFSWLYAQRLFLVLGGPYVVPCASWCWKRSSFLWWETPSDPWNPECSVPHSLTSALTPPALYRGLSAPQTQLEWLVHCLLGSVPGDKRHRVRRCWLQSIGQLIPVTLLKWSSQPMTRMFARNLGFEVRVGVFSLSLMFQWLKNASTLLTDRCNTWRLLLSSQGWTF